MRKITLIFTLIAFSSLVSHTQDISYGIKIGFNVSYLSSSSNVNHTGFPFHELDRNFGITNIVTPGIGSFGGAFFKISPNSSRFNLEFNVLLSSLKNNANIDLSYERYSKDTENDQDKWLQTNDVTFLSNQIRLIQFPINFGVDVFKQENRKLTLKAGVSPNINIYDNSAKIIFGFGEVDLYKRAFLSYQVGVQYQLNRMLLGLKYERSLNVLNEQSDNYFQRTIKVENMSVNTLSISLGYMLK